MWQRYIWYLSIISGFQTWYLGDHGFWHTLCLVHSVLSKASLSHIVLRLPCARCHQKWLIHKYNRQHNGKLSRHWLTICNAVLHSSTWNHLIFIIFAFVCVLFQTLIILIVLFSILATNFKLGGSSEKAKDAYIKAAEMQCKLGSYLFLLLLFHLKVIFLHYFEACHLISVA